MQLAQPGRQAQVLRAPEEGQSPWSDPHTEAQVVRASSGCAKVAGSILVRAHSGINQ